MGRRGEWVKNLRETVMQEWFFGDQDSKEAEKALSKRPKGTFLVRMSASHPGQFTISKMGSSGINHQRITYQPGAGYTLKVRGTAPVRGAAPLLAAHPPAPQAVKSSTSKTKKPPKVVQANCSLPEFIDKHASPLLSLKAACPGSQFEFLRGARPVHEKGTTAGGYVVQDDSDE